MKRLFTLYALVIIPLLMLADTQYYSSEDFMVECTLENESVYQDEACMVTYTLLSPTSDVTGVTKASKPALDKGEFASISSVQVSERPTTKKVKGKEYYAIPIAKYVISVSEKGKYTLKGGVFQIRVSYPVVVRDRFWGNIRTSETKTYNVSCGDTTFKVKSLPKSESAYFSGAIGTFTIKTVIPPGNIIVNEEATAVIELEGYGTIPKDAMPNYKDAFKGNVQLKSISESRNEYLKDGKVVSRLTLTAIFMPKQKNDTSIGEISFDFFNPKTGKYETVKSAPVKVEVKSSTVLRKTIDI